MFAAITSVPTSSLQNFYTDLIGIGCKITIGAANLYVTSLGRWKNSGNSQVHTIRIVETLTGVVVASVTVDMSSGSVGTYVYADLVLAVTLIASTSYYLMSSEISSGDQWRDVAAVISTADLTVVEGIYHDGGGYHGVGIPVASYVPPNFLYNL